MNPKIGHWYLECIRMLIEAFGTVEYEKNDISWILIHSFPLPGTFYQSDSALLIKTPGINIENYDGWEFHMDLDLERLDSTQTCHLIDDASYSNFGHLGYTKLSFHLHSFNPRIPANNGDTILYICQSLYHFLGKKWG